MLLVILGISIISIIVGAIMWSSYDWGSEGLGAALCCVGVIIFVFCTVFTIWTATEVMEGRVIDEKIELLSTQNETIEKKVSEAVTSYSEHEYNTFKELNPESAITLATIYPELKTNELIAQEIELYNENNKKITELKMEKIELTVKKWWLYFGS